VRPTGRGFEEFTCPKTPPLAQKLAILSYFLGKADLTGPLYGFNLAGHITA
jgi:hypothetical protein